MRRRLSVSAGYQPHARASPGCGATVVSRKQPQEATMPPAQTIRKAVVTAGALAALALGGSALADAATSANSSSGTTATQAAPAPRPDPTTPGGHVGANGKTEQALAAAMAAKVEAAAEKKV